MQAPVFEEATDTSTDAWIEALYRLVFASSSNGVKTSLMINRLIVIRLQTLPDPNCLNGKCRGKSKCSKWCGRYQRFKNFCAVKAN